MSKYTPEYQKACGEAALELKEMMCPTDIWEQRASEVINKHLRPLFRELVKIANEKMDSTNEQQEVGDE